MALTVSAKTYNQDSFSKDNVGYTGPAHTVSVEDTVKLSRTAPKPTATLSGVGHTLAKLTRTLTLTGALTPTWKGIVKIDVSVPVGAASADIDSMLNDFGAFLASASFKDHVKSQKITY